MKKSSFAITIMSAVAILIAVVIFVARSLSTPSVITENVAPQLISDKAWKDSVASDPTAHGYSAYGILEERGSDAAIPEGLRDLKSEDAYVWMNAAGYLGSRGRSEAIPYLIKALRHSAWRSDDERVAMLQKLTGMNFDNSFEEWLAWYEMQPNPVVLDWESSLGHKPRIGESDSEQGVAAEPHRAGP